MGLYWYLRKNNIFDINGTDERMAVAEMLGGGDGYRQPTRGALPKRGRGGLNDALLPVNDFSSPAWRRTPKKRQQKGQRR